MNQNYTPAGKAAEARGYEFGQKVGNFIKTHPKEVLLGVSVLYMLKTRRLKRVNRNLRWENRQLINKINEIGSVTNNPPLFEALFGPSRLP